MGIPKFFRFISERWPMISQLIDGDQIPEFDNLYVDMNSILHTCTRPKDTDATKRLTEEEVFSAIFAYIDHLFDTIKPKVVFYMSIDGVAPRAKMNQQRSRRFRAAVDAEKALKNAVQEGVEIPKEPFDSNSITPGTEFMAKLTRYLKYFIHKKVSTDSNWQNVQIILSGHEVPGEGEHKIMEFIRNKKAQKNYNPNIRHCIYGLDSDLIMLGLVSHDPHFALLREEVQFGRRVTQPKSLEEQKFYLLHLSLVREYLELEFSELKDQLSFEYDFERVLDDLILVLYVIGNDFLPNLPDLHLNKGAFPLLLETFKQALTKLDGYINEFGKINLERLGAWLDILSKFEQENFEQEDVDLEWFNKQLENISLTGEKKREKLGKIALLKQQRKLVGFIKPWLIKVYSNRFSTTIEHDSIPRLELPKELTNDNVDFIKTFAYDTDLVITHSKSKDTYMVAVDVDGIDLHETDDEFNERVNEIRRIVKRYEAAIILDGEGVEAVEEKKIAYNEKFENWKDDYYKDKVGFSIKDEDKLREMTENYIEGLQWVLYYYYKGCQSWSWYYRYYYSPRISDIKTGLGIKINLEKGQPFKPFEQLMAVLPARSKNLVPAPYRPLMTDEHSQIFDFYPNDVEIDMNGKTAEWEAVVKISFVDQVRLQKALIPLDSQLSLEEKQRNSFGNDILFTFNPQIHEVFKSPLPGIFTDLEDNCCFEVTYKLTPVAEEDYLNGLPNGAKLGANALAGFPTLKTIPFKDELKAAGVMIFNQPSRGNSIILTPKNVHESLSVEQFAKRFISKVVYTNYPYLRESKIVRVSDGHHEYYSPMSERELNVALNQRGAEIVSRLLSQEDSKAYKASLANVKRYYSVSRGIELGDVHALVYVKNVSGLKRTSDGAYVKAYSESEELFPLELVVETVNEKDSRYYERPPLPINEEFPLKSKVIFFGDYAYGDEATVVGYASTSRLNINVQKKSIKAEPTIGTFLAQRERQTLKYFPSFTVSKKLNLHPLFLSKLTSSLMVLNSKGQKVNVGLDLKFEAKREKVIGYSRKNEKGWQYSSNTIAVLNNFKRSFPDFFNALSIKSIESRDMPSVDQIWPMISATEADSKLKTVADWVKSVKAPLERVSLESDGLSPSSIQTIESQIEVFAAQPEKSDFKKLLGVPRVAVLDPSVSFNKLKSQSFELGDRVIYVHDSGKVPLSAKGTVVAYSSIGSNVTLQVLFDKTLIGGNKLGGKIRTNRGLDVDSSLVLNISNRQFIYHSKASASKKTPAKVNGSKKSIIALKKTSNDTTAIKTVDITQKPVTAHDLKVKVSKPIKREPKKSNQNNEFLTLLKSKKGDKEEVKDNEEDSNEKSKEDPSKAFKLKAIQASVLIQMNGVPQPQPEPQPILSGFPIPLQGFPAYPGQVLPPLYSPTQGLTSQQPVQQQQDQQKQAEQTAKEDSNVKQYNLKNGKASRNGINSRGRGRGNFRGNFRGKKTESKKQEGNATLNKS